MEKSCFSQPGLLLCHPLLCPVFAFCPLAYVSSLSVSSSAKRRNCQLLCLTVLPFVCPVVLSWSVCERVSSSSRGSVFLSGAFLVPLLLLDSICVCLSSHLSHLHPAPPLPDPSLLFWMPRVWQGRVGRASVPRPWLLLQLLPSLLPKKFLETESPSLHPRRPQRAPGSGTRRMELSPGQLSH